MSLPAVVEKVAPSVKPSSNGIASCKESTCRISTKALVILMGVTNFLVIGLTYHDGAVINSTPFQEIFVEDSERVGGLSSNRNLMFDKKHFETLYLHNSNDKHPRPMHKLVDFVIAGFPKCGTTTMVDRLDPNPQVYMGGDASPTKKRAGERHELKHTEEHYFNDFFDRYSMENINKGTNLEGPGGKVLKQVVGFKAPEVLRSEPFLSNNVVDFFPGVDLVVSIRHPVLHFQSNFNYKMRFADSTLKLPDTKDLIGDCEEDCHHHCTPKVPFIDSITHKKGHGSAMCTMISTYHYALSRLALTPMEEEEEKKLLASPYHKVSIEDEWTGRLFLMELGQMADTNSTRHDKFERSFEDFLGIEANSFTTERKNHQPRPKLINICDDKHREVREHLNGIARESSKWITDYLLRSDRVVVANREHFLELMKEWEKDPCATAP